MDLSTQTHLKALRQALEFRRDQLRGEIAGAERARRAPLEERETGGRADEAVRLQAGDVAEAEERRDVVELEAVERALGRLDAGVYGDCSDCGEPIAFERLRVQPSAARCAHCQQAHERSLEPHFAD